MPHSSDYRLGRIVGMLELFVYVDESRRASVIEAVLEEIQEELGERKLMDAELWREAMDWVLRKVRS